MKKAIREGIDRFPDDSPTTTRNRLSKVGQEDIILINEEYVFFITEMQRKPTYMDLYDRLCANVRWGFS